MPGAEATGGAVGLVGPGRGYDPGASLAAESRVCGRNQPSGPLQYPAITSARVCPSMNCMA